MAIDTKATSRPHRYSFSGADAKGFAYYPGMEDKIHLLESLNTISISVHEAKGQGRALGYRSVKGVAKGIRTIGGSIIMTVIEDHPLRDLVSSVGEYAGREPAAWGGWSLDRGQMGTGTALDNFDFNNKLATLLPPFNILMTFVSEGAQFSDRKVYTSDIRSGSGPVDTLTVNSDPDSTEQNLRGSAYDIPGAGYLIEYIDIIDVGMVTSTNDVVTELTLSFIARNFRPLAPLTFGTGIEVIPTEDEKRQRSVLGKLFPDAGTRTIRKFNRQQDKARRELHRAGEAAGLTPEEIERDIMAAGLGRIGE